MKNIPPEPDFMKRKLLTLLASVPLFTACIANSGNLSTDPEDVRLRKKFRGIYGLVLRIDATSPKHRVIITNETGRVIDSPSILAPKGGGSLTYTDNSMPVPKAIRATWREGAGWDSVNKVWNEGIVVGDYTVPVADRIPDSILDYIRENGGALRLKIRLKDDGILIGWDVERRVHKGSWCVKSSGETCFQVEYFIPGGDFLETKY
jgi:hypothetical protein